MTHVPHVSNRFRPLSASAAGLAAVATLIGLGLGVAATSTDALVARAFTTALGTPAIDAGRQPQASAPLVAGTEDYWLTKARGQSAEGRIEPANWSEPATPFGVSVGDRITVTSAGKERVLEVVEVVEAGADVTRIDTAEPSHRQLLVTCRDTSTPGGRLVRFLTDPEPPPASGAKPTRTL